MIILYEKTESNFNHNGLAVLDGVVVSPVVFEQLNGLFSLEFDYPIHAKASDKLRPEMIVKCPVPELQDQLFRIVERDDANGGLLHIVAHHIFYDLAKNLIEDTYIVNKNGSGALTQLLGATAASHSFTGTSNITTVNNVRLVRLNPVEVLLDADLDNGYQSRFGGEIVRDNYSISMLAHRGSDNGVQIRDKKNLTGYKSDLDYSSIVTRIMPEGYDFSGQPVTVPTTDKNVEEPFEGTYHNITIQPMDKDGNPIGGPLTVGAQTGEPVTIPAPEGYEYIGSPLTMPTTDESYDLPYQGILHEFSFVPLDENGNPIGDPIILTGRTGEVITIPDIPGYNFEGGEITVPAKDTVSGNYIHIAENPENSEADLIKPVSHSNNNSANNSQTKLPQTSEKSSVAMSLLGLASVAISLFALSGASKKRKKD